MHLLIRALCKNTSHWSDIKQAQVECRINAEHIKFEQHNCNCFSCVSVARRQWLCGSLYRVNKWFLLFVQALAPLHHSLDSALVGMLVWGAAF